MRRFLWMVEHCAHHLHIKQTRVERKDTFKSKTYHVNFTDRMEASLITTLLHAGVKLGTTSLLTVRGRKSGQPHTVPVLLVEQDGERQGESVDCLASDYLCEKPS